MINNVICGFVCGFLVGFLGHYYYYYVNCECEDINKKLNKSKQDKVTKLHEKIDRIYQIVLQIQRQLGGLCLFTNNNNNNACQTVPLNTDQNDANIPTYRFVTPIEDIFYDTSERQALIRIIYA